MRDLYFFPNENILCWIAGYTTDTVTLFVSEKINSLSENAKKFSEVAKVDIRKVQTAFVDKSSRYKNMRVFYAQINPDDVPKTAYVISGPDRTMWKWLTY